MKTQWVVSRRSFLKATVGSGLATGILAVPIKSSHSEVLCRFGLVTDAHYADVSPNGNRHYRESKQKMEECVQLMNDQQVSFLVQLGDLKDQNNPPDEAETLSFLKTIENVFSGFYELRLYVIGNHDIDSISKDQYWEHVQMTIERNGRSYYSYEYQGLRFVVLDANFNSDGSDYDHGNFDWTDANIPDHELQWLQSKLEQTDMPTIVFCHQLLDGEGSVYVNNAKEVREILESSNQVLAVFQGHHHEGQHNLINGIHYYTLKAMVEGSGAENNSYAIASVMGNGDIEITGYRRVVDQTMEHS